MTNSLLQIILGFGLAGVISLAAYLAQSLSVSGALAAFILGGLVFGLGGLPASILLITFFLSSSILSKLFKKRKTVVEKNFAKGSQRDAGQVAANGAIAGLIILLSVVAGLPIWLWAAFAGALAAVTADTWATELGVLSKQSPRLITSGKVVAPGTSGGITITGTAAALGGAVLIAFLATIILKLTSPTINISQTVSLFFMITLAGLMGSLVDSFLGAAWQAIYYCESCQALTEKHPLHTCGNKTNLNRGKKWLNNDWVNSFCSLSGALLAGILAFLFINTAVPLPIQEGRTNMKQITLSSSAFLPGQPIPVRFSCSGENISPEISWEGVPVAAKSLVLIMDDPDAPMGTYTHWVVYNLPPKITGLPEGVPPGNFADGATQGLNSASQNKYMGPCPPPGKLHHYFFKLFASDRVADFPKGLTADKLTALISDHIVAGGEYIGTFQR